MSELFKLNEEDLQRLKEIGRELPAGFEEQAGTELFSPENMWLRPYLFTLPAAGKLILAVLLLEETDFTSEEKREGVKRYTFETLMQDIGKYAKEVGTDVTAAEVRSLLKEMDALEIISLAENLDEGYFDRFSLIYLTYEDAAAVLFCDPAMMQSQAISEKVYAIQNHEWCYRADYDKKTRELTEIDIYEHDYCQTHRCDLYCFDTGIKKMSYWKAVTLRNEILMAYAIEHPERPYPFMMYVHLFRNIKSRLEREQKNSQELLNQYPAVPLVYSMCERVFETVSAMDPELCAAITSAENEEEGREKLYFDILAKAEKDGESLSPSLLYSSIFPGTGPYDYSSLHRDAEERRKQKNKRYHYH